MGSWRGKMNRDWDRPNFWLGQWDLIPGNFANGNMGDKKSLMGMAFSVIRGYQVLFFLIIPDIKYFLRSSFVPGNQPCLWFLNLSVPCFQASRFFWFPLVCTFFFFFSKFLSLPTWRLKAKLCRHVLQERLFLKLSIFLPTILPFIQKTGNVRLLWNVHDRENLEKAFCLKTGIEDSSKQRGLRDVSVEIFHIDVVEIGSALCSSKNWQGRKLCGGFCWGFLCSWN